MYLISSVISQVFDLKYHISSIWYQVSDLKHNIVGIGYWASYIKYSYTGCLKKNSLWFLLNFSCYKHLKDGIHRFVQSAKTFLFDIRKPIYKPIYYHIPRFQNYAVLHNIEEPRYKLKQYEVSVLKKLDCLIFRIFDIMIPQIILLISWPPILYKNVFVLQMGLWILPFKWKHDLSWNN